MCIIGPNGFHSVMKGTAVFQTSFQMEDHFLTTLTGDATTLSTFSKHWVCSHWLLQPFSFCIKLIGFSSHKNILLTLVSCRGGLAAFGWGGGGQIQSSGPSHHQIGSPFRVPIIHNEATNRSQNTHYHIQ